MRRTTHAALLLAAVTLLTSTLADGPPAVGGRGEVSAAQEATRSRGNLGDPSRSPGTPATTCGTTRSGRRLLAGPGSNHGQDHGHDRPRRPRLRIVQSRPGAPGIVGQGARFNRVEVPPVRGTKHHRPTSAPLSRWGRAGRGVGPWTYARQKPKKSGRLLRRRDAVREDPHRRRSRMGEPQNSPPGGSRANDHPRDKATYDDQPHRASRVTRSSEQRRAAPFIGQRHGDTSVWKWTGGVDQMATYLAFAAFGQVRRSSADEPAAGRTMLRVREGPPVDQARPARRSQ